METGKETILRLYAAYRRQDIDEVVAGMQEQARFQAVPTTRMKDGRILEFQPFMDPQEAVEKFRDAAFA